MKSTRSRRRIELELFNYLIDLLKPLLKSQRRGQRPRDAGLDNQVSVFGLRYLADFDYRAVESHSSNNLQTKKEQKDHTQNP